MKRPAATITARLGVSDARRRAFLEALARMVARRVLADLVAEKANPAAATTPGGDLDRKRRREHQQATP